MNVKTNVKTNVKMNVKTNVKTNVKIKNLKLDLSLCLIFVIYLKL